MLIPSKANDSVEIKKCPYCAKKMPKEAVCINTDESDFCSNYNTTKLKEEISYIKRVTNLFKGL